MRCSWPPHPIGSQRGRGRPPHPIGSQRGRGRRPSVSVQATGPTPNWRIGGWLATNSRWPGADRCSWVCYCFYFAPWKMTCEDRDEHKRLDIRTEKQTASSDLNMQNGNFTCTVYKLHFFGTAIRGRLNVPAHEWIIKYSILICPHSIKSMVCCVSPQWLPSCCFHFLKPTQWPLQVILDLPVSRCSPHQQPNPAQNRGHVSWRLGPRHSQIRKQLTGPTVQRQTSVSLRQLLD